MTLAYLTDADPPRLSNELCSQLRLGTAAAHEELEGSLDLLCRVSDRQWYRAVLERFFGFHVVWEQAIGARKDLKAFHEPRSRIPHLRRDLAALGLTKAELDELPRCTAASLLAESRSEAIGSIYVMEGSTLGGQVISRALAGQPWLPAGGLTYFHPYGSDTGRMWRDFRSWAERQVEPQDHAAATRGANATFAKLTDWLSA